METAKKVLADKSSRSWDKLLIQVKKDFPELTFMPAPRSSWSPKNKVVYYNMSTASKHRQCSLLHEIAHSLLKHTNFGSDFELLQIEIEAWEKAKTLAKNYGLSVNDLHIQDCLDTYRDWLHDRSSCPDCGLSSIQHNKTTYRCLNCLKSWSVSTSRMNRPYRRTKQKATPSE